LGPNELYLYCHGAGIDFPVCGCRALALCMVDITVHFLFLEEYSMEDSRNQPCLITVMEKEEQTIFLSSPAWAKKLYYFFSNLGKKTFLLN
jgi:hypothetical protein